MKSEKRRLYLEEKWIPYPSVDVKVLTFAEFKAEFSKLTSGGQIQNESFWLAGRVGVMTQSSVSHQIEQMTFTADGEEHTLKLELLNANPELVELVQDVLQPRDQILIRVAWQHVYTSGMFPKVEGLSPQEIVLLAPATTAVESHALPIMRAKQWQRFLALTRACFEFLQFVEVKTPTLVGSPGLEPFIDPFETQFRLGSQTETFYLPTSPEFSLKKILAQGYTRIFEFKDSFRNGELSPHHQPEFLMLEWYRAYANLDAILKDLRGYLNYLKLHWSHNIKAWGPLEVKTMAQLFQEVLDFELTPQTTKEELEVLAHELELYTLPTDSWNDIFHRIFIEKMEPHIGHSHPVVVRNFPPSQCAWARLTPAGWADRFELYWRGMEIANAFHELNDPIEQRRRFEEANRERRDLDKKPLPIDENLMKAMESGFPPSGGVALGLDRLFMLLIDEPEIVNTRFFPHGVEGRKT